jgi:hypothetical protein
MLPCKDVVSKRKGGGLTVLPIAPRSKRQEAFYRTLIPALVLVNLGLGVFNLAVSAQPHHFLTWALLALGAFSCVLAGWLWGAWWLRCRWTQAVNRQIEFFDRLVSAVLGWTEEVSTSKDALYRLKRRIDRVVSNS